MPRVEDQLSTDRFPLEKSEAEHLLERRGKPYSLGHQRCYIGPAELIAQGDRAVSIIEFGSGTGWGYQRIAERVNLARYVGIERHADSVAIHRSSLLRPTHSVIHGSILTRRLFEGYDYAFCIEVAEHITEEFHPILFAEMARSLVAGGVLFMSTPDASKHDHGNLTPEQAKAALRAAGFSSVVTIPEQWTTLYIAQK